MVSLFYVSCDNQSDLISIIPHSSYITMTTIKTENAF